MRLFKTMEAGPSSAMEQTQDKAQNKKSKGVRPPKPHLSASEIRSKVREHMAPKEPEKDKVEVSQLAKTKNVAKPQVEDEQIEETKELARPSDVGLNDPNDPATVGKLKSVLSKGGFNFNPLEREALEKILAEKD